MKLQISEYSDRMLRQTRVFTHTVLHYIPVTLFLNQDLKFGDFFSVQKSCLKLTTVVFIFRYEWITQAHLCIAFPCFSGR